MADHSASTQPKDTLMNLLRYEPAANHRLYSETNGGLQFECRRLSDERIRDLAMAADRLVARTPNSRPFAPDKSIQAFFDRLSDLASWYRAPREVQDVSPGRTVGEIAQLRRSVRLRTNRHPLIGTYDSWVSGRPRMSMAIVFAPVSVESCTLCIDPAT
jgi:hypothetical protein